MPGANSSSLVFTNAQVADAASYDVLVTNINGSLTSTVAVLAVTPLPPRVVTNCSGADLYSAMVRGGTVTIACDGTIGLTAPIAYDTVLDASGHSVTLSGEGRWRVFYVATNQEPYPHQPDRR